MKKGVAIGIDVGGTNIKAGLVDEEGQLLARHVISTAKKQEPAVILGQIEDLVGLLREASPEKVLGVGLALPGAVDDPQGYCLYCPNLGWGELEIRTRFAANTGLPVRIINDANAACLGEYLYGSSQDSNTFLSITLGTGIGSGLILNKHLYTGSFGSGVEAGHMVIEPHGSPCNCGGRGCWETLVSASGITRRAKDSMGKELTPELIFQCAREGDAQARRIVEETVFYLAVGLANLINLFNPDEISIGGGVAEAAEIISPDLFALIEKNVFPVFKGKAHIHKASQGYYGGVIGASTLWLHKINMI